MNEENKLTEEQKAERRKMARGFLESAFYLKYVEPMMDDKIRRSGKIETIDKTSDETIVKSFKENLNKMENYRGIKNKFYDWAGVKIKKIR